MLLTSLTTSPRIQVALGKAAGQLLNAPGFQKDWADLFSACTWATGFQTWEFADAWYNAYKDIYEALLVFQRDGSGRLIGLLPLAVEVKSNSLVYVGAQQAEYQVWIASELTSDAFIEQALSLLKLHYPQHRLRLKYLPAGVPLGWRSHWRRWGWLSILQTHRRPLLALGAGSSVEKSLKKSGNRSKINRLKRIGALSFVHVKTRVEFEQLIDTIADFYDLRQGALSSSLPFRDDMRKKEFTLRLLDKPGLAHASVLMLDNKPIAVNIGLVSPTFVSIGVFGYSPFYTESSPGRMHILLLGEHLGENGVRALDLTPGGNIYKDEMADRTDQVYALSIDFNVAKQCLEAAKASLIGILKRLLTRKGKSIALKIWDQLSNPVTYTKSVVIRLNSAGQRDSAKYCYEFDISAVGYGSSGELFQVNSISDLLLYKPSRKYDQSKKVFFDYVWRRLEAGDRAYTYSENNTLMYCTWLRQPAKDLRSNSDGGVKSPQNACLLWDSYTHPTADMQELMRKSVHQRIHDAAKIQGLDRILVEIQAAPFNGMNPAGQPIASLHQ